MMLSVSGLITTSAVDGAAAAAETHLSGGGASGGSSDVGASSSAPAGGVEENERTGGGGGGNRWPRPETLSLLKIRSDMDATFRDASLKGPLWEEVSRKMAELGFQRSAKKCKEKFENVFKYHKRTKDGRATKADGKSYRFFDQLEALENTSPNHFTIPPPPRPHPPSAAAPMAGPASAAAAQMPSHVITVPSAPSPIPLSVVHPNNSSSFQPPSQPPPLHHQLGGISAPHPRPHHHSHPFSNSTSSSTSSDEDIQRRRGTKRKWRDYFEKLTADVVRKQEELQRKFLEALERRERDRIAWEETWRVQEMARMNREHDLLVQERSAAAAKDAAVISFLQKVTGHTDNPHVPITYTNHTQQPQPMQLQPPPPPPPPPEPQTTPTITLEMTTASRDNGGGGDDHISAGSSRWPKAEVEALIKLRTDLELKYQENGPKGPLWEEISKAMSNLGYKRSSKRCKEKWENINKYFKKVKESNKKRPEDSKTCPYFHQLDAIYRERAKSHATSFNLGYAAKPDGAAAPIMARPEQQWPQPSLHEPDLDNDSENRDDDDDDDDDDDEVGDYEMIANKQPSSLANVVE